MEEVSIGSQGLQQTVMLEEEGGRKRNMQKRKEEEECITYLSVSQWSLLGLYKC